jgi:saccharopine dehydrogenase-like NADP-dependent oxidoreductase
VIAVELLASRSVHDSGVLPLELLGTKPDLFAAFVDRLAARGVALKETEEDPWPR